MKPKTYFLPLLLLLLSLNLSAQDLDLNLLINYPFSGDFQDQSVNQFHSPSSNATFTEDRFGNSQNAAFFDGSECVVFPDDSALKPQFPFSFSFWIKPEVQFIRAEGIVGTDQFENNYYGAFVSILNSGKLMAGYGDGCGSTGPECRISEVSDRVFENNEWYHIVTIFKSSSDIELFVNGCKETTTPSGVGSQQMVYSDEPGAIGKKDHSDINGNPIGYYHGVIDDFYFWDRVVQEDEIALLVDEYFGMETSVVEYQGCQNDGYFVEINGTSYNENNPSGTENMVNPNGCLTNVTIDLIFSPTSQTIIEEIICNNPTYSITVNNTIYNQANPTGTELLINQNGCDTLYNIELSFSGSSENISVEICEGEEATVNDQIYSVGGNFTQTYQNTMGCDSIFNVTVSMLNNIESNLQYAICNGESITLNGEVYQAAGTYQQNFNSINGCDSIVYINIFNESMCSDCIFDTEFTTASIILNKLEHNKINASLIQSNHSKMNIDLSEDEFLQFIAFYIIDNESTEAGNKSQIIDLINGKISIQNILIECKWSKSLKFNKSEIINSLPFSNSDLPNEINAKKLDYLYSNLSDQIEKLRIGGNMKINLR